MTFSTKFHSIRAMFPWTTPPTCWPTSPQPATTSSTWPPQPPSIASTSRPPMTWPTTAPSSSSAPHPGYPIDPHQYSISQPHMLGTAPTSVEHLFGQPSALHPAWPSTTSFQATTHATPPPSFTSLATAPHPVPAQHLVPSTTPTLGSDSTTFHSVTPTFATPTGPTFSTAWPTAPAPAHEPAAPPVPLPSSPYPPRVHQPQPVATATSTPPPATPRQTAVKAAPKIRSEKKPEKTRRSVPTAPKKACWYLKNGIAYLILWEVPIAYLKFRHLGQSLSIPYILLVWQGFHGYIR